MRLASAPGIALAFIAWACASHSSAEAPAAADEAHSPEHAIEPQSAPSGVDLSREQQLVEEARAASTAVDLASARAKAAEAIELLLARPESERDAKWLELVYAAGRVAWYARDARAARAAWERVLEARSRTLPDEHPDLLKARQNVAVTLRTLGDLPAARALEEKVLEVRSRTLPNDHPDLQAARQNLAVTLYTLGDLAAARALQEKVLELRSRTLPDEHPDLQQARNDLANTLGALGDLAAARALQERVLEVRSRTLPDDHPDLQAARGNLANTLCTLGDLATARALGEKVLEVFSRTLPDDHPDLQAARQIFANTLGALGDLAAARALEEKVLEVRSRTLPDEHPDLQQARNDLANTLGALGDLAAARALQERVLEVRSRTLPDDHPDLQAARVNLANTLYTLGDLATARALGEKVLEVFSRTLPDDHPHLQAARQISANTLGALGDLAAARALEEKVLEVRSRTLPDEHPDLQAARGNLANTLRGLGDLAAARALQERVLEVRSRTLPDDHPDLQQARHNLAVTLQTLGDFAAARPLQEKVLEVRSRTLPDDHPHLQAVRSHLALTLKRLGDLAAARALEEKVLEVRSRTLPDEHSELHHARGNFANTLWMLGDLAAARALQEKILKVFSRTLPDDHPNLQAARGNLAVTLAAEYAAENGKEERKGEEEGGREEFARLAASFTRAIARSARAVVLMASSREAEEHCANSQADLGRALSFAEGLRVFELDPGLQREAFVLSEETRGAALASAHLSRRASADPGYGKLREAMRSASDELARLARQGAEAEEFYRARSARDAAELKLAQLARELSGGEQGVLELDPGSLSASLSERVALVGYRRYTRSVHEPGGEYQVKESESLCAFVLRSGDRLVRIELGPIEPIDRAVSSLRQAIGAGAGRGVGAGAAQSVKADLVLTEGRVVRRLIFDPLLPSLEGAERIVVALDDVLNLVPLDALPLESAGRMPGLAEESLLGDRWRIETRCTLSELLWKTAPVPPSGALVAIGGAAFDLPPLLFSGEETQSIEERRAASPGVDSLLRGGAWEAGFAPLEATGPEAVGISVVHREAFGDAALAFVLEKRGASRDSLAELASRARFLHIATHGWFAPESVRSLAEPGVLDAKMGFGARMSGEERAKGMSPMLLCGLALAGANLSEDELGRAPGLVTAEEISTLDLSGCELAVLSACDTNVGERRAGQGVASLQKALHMAGARTVITSLWKVPDEATRELMLDFYRRIWIEKKPKGVALWEAKTKIRDALDGHGRPLYSTRDWAAWVLTGDPN